MFNISISDLLKLDNPIIVDIRNYYDYSLGHINGAISIPYYNLENNYNHYLNKYNRYYLYCENGKKSMEISNKLNDNGYDTISVDGGYKEYKKITNQI